MNGRIELRGVSLIGGGVGAGGGKGFRGVNPASGAELEPEFCPASGAEVERAAELARAAAGPFGASSGRERGGLLRAIADGLAEAGAGLIERAHVETGLTAARLTGELGRTTGQLRLFAEVVEEGSWVGARIDEADPERRPMAKPDLRSMLRPLGPVAVFGASNFPLAFSVAGGDTAAALAAGCPVIVKAHPAHPGTSELAGRVIQAAVAACGLPEGVFSLLFDDGFGVGTALVEHPAIKAVAFTGSPSGGQALMRLAAARPEPIPCYAEMGSTNPLFILPQALRERGAALAAGLVASFTLGSGQFCTKPGVVFVPEAGGEAFLEALRGAVGGLGRMGMLTPGIAARYGQMVTQRMSAGQAEVFAGAQAVAEAEGAAAGMPVVFGVTLDEFRAHPELGEEVFGPTTLLVRYGAEDAGLNDLIRAAEGMHGHLTATIHGTAEDLARAAGLVRMLEGKVGRILFNGFPTGVEVAHAMVHGGPFPATSDGRSTSVGTMAMLRFARPVCYQDFPDEALPEELQRTNPLRIVRMDGRKDGDEWHSLRRLLHSDMHLQPKISFEQYRECFLVVCAAKPKPVQKRSWQEYSMLAVLCLALGIAPQFRASRVPGFTIDAALLFCAVLSKPLNRRVRDKQLRRFYDEEKVSLNDQLLTIDESGISCDRPDGRATSHQTWKSFLKCIEIADALSLSSISKQFCPGAEGGAHKCRPADGTRVEFNRPQSTHLLIVMPG